MPSPESSAATPSRRCKRLNDCVVGWDLSCPFRKWKKCPDLGQPLASDATTLLRSDAPIRATTRFVAFYKGQQYPLTARDQMHARVVAYMAIWPESKWSEVKAYAV